VEDAAHQKVKEFVIFIVMCVCNHKHKQNLIVCLHARTGMSSLSPTEKRLSREQGDFQDGTLFVSNETRTHWRVTCKTPLGRTLTFEMDCSYPFKPPIVKQYNILYQNIMYHHRLLLLYQKMYKNCGCPCCLRVFQAGSWSPCLTLKRVYDTVVKEEKKWDAVFRVFLKKVFRDRLPDDVYHSIALFM